MKKLAIYGRAGIGKSTLCQYISVRWSGGNLWNDKYKGVIWLPLRKIASELKNWQEDISLAEVIREHCMGGRERYKPSVEAIDNFIGNFSDILFILDGYDEIAPIVDNLENREGEKIRRILKEILTVVLQRIEIGDRCW
ncbi:hypothetical protein NF27_FG00010 [Candidatus Jidaibacter acanthamoeba]|uniref:NACHT domain-containing protein n=1 Tax=Candidatus Jidaibacter acanthamoebae TaxID=86105 RepID=A0A0C1QH56_9RICK|nr:hypothetical protein NF27_FG00010 [Candidatus Jidaibacter acanthamoeba]